MHTDRSDASLTLDADRRIVHADDAAAALFGSDPAALVGSVVEVLGSDVLRRSRMESLGQLAGGLAHDLNNLLTVIMNYSRFVSSELTDPALRSDVEEIDRASQQAADLVHRLLVFARQEVGHPQVLDLNEVIEGLARPLGRTLGTSVRLRLDLEAQIEPTMIDPGQLEQVLVSLVLNARDALPEGGEVVVRTGGHDGTVWLSVEDAGIGMTPDVASRAFEPFFTTKPAGEGSGLGLATVYGIVTGAQGQVDLRSEVAVGTVVRVELPVTDAPREPLSTRPNGSRQDGTETILLADDEQAVRETARRILVDAGYEVLAVDSGEEALAVADAFEGPIHLLLTDLVMPRVGGTELARRLVGVRPGIGILYMSGYSRELFEGPGSGGPDIPLLEKPFDGPALLEHVRAVIDETEARHRG